MRFLKKVIIPSEKVDASIISDGDPPKYRLMPTNKRVKNKVDYKKSVEDALKEASNGKAVAFTIDDGFRSKQGKTRMYFICKPDSHNAGRHVLFHDDEALQPGHDLLLTWEIKCEVCKKNIPADEKDMDTPNALSQIPVEVIINEHQSDQENQNFTVNLEGHDTTNELFIIYNRITDRLAQILDESYNHCIMARNPLAEAMNKKTELSVRLALAASDALSDVGVKQNVSDVRGKQNVSDVRGKQNVSDVGESDKINQDEEDGIVNDGLLSSRASQLLQNATIARKHYEDKQNQEKVGENLSTPVVPQQESVSCSTEKISEIRPVRKKSKACSTKQNKSTEQTDDETKSVSTKSLDENLSSSLSQQEVISSAPENVNKIRPLHEDLRQKDDLKTLENEGPKISPNSKACTEQQTKLTVKKDNEEQPVRKPRQKYNRDVKSSKGSIDRYFTKRNN